MSDPKEQFADVSIKRLATIYAEALLNAAEAAGTVPQVLEEVDSVIDDVFKNDARLDALFGGAAVGRKARKEAIQKAFAGRACDPVYKFLLVLNDHDRLDLLRPIRKALHDVHDERTRHLRVAVFSAVPLQNGYRSQIEQTVRERFNLEPIIDMHVDPSLLGGLKVRIADTVYDMTVRTRIDNLRNQLVASSSHEIQSRRDRFSSAE